MTTALIVVDIQNEYFDGGLLPLWQAEETEQRIVDEIRRVRGRRDKIVLIQHASDAKTGLFAQGARGVEIRSMILEAAGGAPVVQKRFADSFQGTDLMAHIADCDTLHLCGMMTQNCVAFTALSRLADPFKLRVLGNLCTAPTQMVHNIAINALASKCEVVDRPV